VSLADAVRFLAERHAGTGARLFQCPHCAAEVVAIAVEVGHRCPADRHRWTRFVVVDVEEKHSA